MFAGEYTARGLAVGQHGADGSWCVVSGRLERPDLPDGSSAEAVLAAGFAARGELILDELGGSFSLAVWDAAARKGMLAIDPLGAGALFLRETPGRLLFATELRDLLELLPGDPAPSSDAVARWLGKGALRRDETLYDGIRRLPGGSVLRLEGGRWREDGYWRPRYRRPRPIDRPAAAAEVRGAVERAVAARCTEDRIGVQLSGGLDSSTVAATAARGRSGLVAYSAVFPDHPETDESEQIRLTAGELRLPDRAYEVRATTVLRFAADHAERWALPPASPNLFFQVPLLELARDDGIGLMLDGQGGDELFGPAPGVGARARRPSARAVRSTLRAVRRRLRPAPTGLDGRVPGLLRTPAEPAPPLDLDGPRWWRALADQLTAARERAGVHDHLRRKLRTVGLRGGHPFLDDLPLVELVLGLPPELALDPVLDRPLLREAMRGTVPESVLRRTTKNTFDRLLVDCIAGPDRELVAALLCSPRAEILAYVRPEPLRELAVVPARPDLPWAWTAWRLASVETWLRRLARGA